MKNELKKSPIDLHTQERVKYFTKCLSVIMSADRRADSVPMAQWNEHFGKAELLIGEPCEFVQNLLQPKDFKLLVKAAHIAHIEPEIMITFCNLFACEMSELSDKAAAYQNEPTLRNRLSVVNQNQLVTLLAASVLGNFEFSTKNSYNISDFFVPIQQLHQQQNSSEHAKEFLLQQYDNIWEKDFKLPKHFSTDVKTVARPFFTPAQQQDDVLDWIQDGAKEVFSNGKYLSANSVLLIMEKQGFDWRNYIQTLDSQVNGKDTTIKYVEFNDDIRQILNKMYLGKNIIDSEYKTKFSEAKKADVIRNPYEESQLVKALECLSKVSDIEIVGKVASVYFDTKQSKW